MRKKKTLPYNSIRIKKRLVELNMTQREFAESIGMNENYLTAVLNGRRSGRKYMNIIMTKLGLVESEQNFKKEVV
ncbi:MAG: transcriptional regulator [Alkaliphilus sp.]|nr:helix-turn-helix transcriptional regulator [Alkaliphilus transvaalensis]MBN4069884.1 helix-turn-helix transcriptional regulator [bacterium AH-315-G05]PHS29778.1 MAG: transcriptional regulator [Alkaliphilus sp.]